MQLKKERAFILAAVKQNGQHHLEYASEELKKDREIVLEAVKAYGRTLQLTPVELHSDCETVFEAELQDGQRPQPEAAGDRRCCFSRSCSVRKVFAHSCRAAHLSAPSSCQGSSWARWPCCSRKWSRTSPSCKPCVTM